MHLARLIAFENPHLNKARRLAAVRSTGLVGAPDNLRKIMSGGERKLSLRPLPFSAVLSFFARTEGGRTEYLHRREWEGAQRKNIAELRCVVSAPTVSWVALGPALGLASNFLRFEQPGAETTKY